jgi:hypothetical protein
MGQMDNQPALPLYALEKLLRHGPAVERLVSELRNDIGEFGSHSVASALAFDAADMIWAALISLGVPEAHQTATRAIRNQIAEAILAALEPVDGIPRSLSGST